MRPFRIAFLFSITVFTGLGAGVHQAGADEPKRGGTMTLTYKDDIATLDPAIGYDWQNPSMMQALFDGLMDYKPGTFQLVPELAESYTVSDGGKTYTFKLRRGSSSRTVVRLPPLISSTPSSASSIQRPRARPRAISA